MAARWLYVPIITRHTSYCMHAAKPAGDTRASFWCRMMANLGGCHDEARGGLQAHERGSHMPVHARARADKKREQATGPKLVYNNLIRGRPTRPAKLAKLANGQIRPEFEKTKICNQSKLGL